MSAEHLMTQDGAGTGQDKPRSACPHLTNHVSAREQEGICSEPVGPRRPEQTGQPRDIYTAIIAGISTTHTSPQKQGWREAQVPGRAAVCSTERLNMQQAGNIQIDALQHAQLQCFNQGPPILSFSQVINPEEVIIPDAATQESLHTKLKSIKAWTKKITIQLILRDFTSFMEKTVRAVRYLKNTRSFSA